MSALPQRKTVIRYPGSDGLPIAENTVQFRWIVTVKEGLDAQFRHDPEVFVAGDLFWYPVKGDPTIRVAPDTLIAFGRPKGDRLSCLQWEENGIAPQVVFEILSPGNRPREMTKKFEFYQHYGVDEYYLYDPDYNSLDGWIRNGAELRSIPEMNDWVSPRLGIRFDLAGPELRIIARNGEPFATYQEVYEQRDAERQHAELARHEARLATQRADQEAQRADRQAQRAEQEAQRAEQEAQRAEQQAQRAERLAARLRELGHNPDNGQ